MTRINLIPPAKLHNKHLLAEYRELPRVFKLARDWWERDGDLSTLPRQYTMGKGHVKFFYDKGLWLYNRQCALYDACIARGFKVQHDPVKSGQGFFTVPKELFNDWDPSARDIAINKKRIYEKLKLMGA